MQSSIEVRWNGVNDGHDGDLLDDELRIPEKRLGGPISRNDQGWRDLHPRSKGLKLEAYLRDPISRVELMEWSGLRRSSVTHWLSAWRKTGRLRIELGGKEPGRGRRECKYWLEDSCKG